MHLTAFVTINQYLTGILQHYQAGLICFYARNSTKQIFSVPRAGLLEHRKIIYQSFQGGFAELHELLLALQIEEVDLGSGEPMWSRNMKKGMLSLFQLDLVKGRHEHPDAVQYHVNEVR